MNMPDTRSLSQQAMKLVKRLQAEKLRIRDCDTSLWSRDDYAIAQERQIRLCRLEVLAYRRLFRRRA